MSLEEGLLSTNEAGNTINYETPTSTPNPESGIPSASKISQLRKRKESDYHPSVRLIFPLLILIGLPVLYYSQHHRIGAIRVKISVYTVPIWDGVVKKFSVWSTIHDLWNMGYHKNWGLVILTFVWSGCYPWVKFIGVFLLWFCQCFCSRTDRGFRLVNRILTLLHWLGKWSYADLYVTMTLDGTLAGSGVLRPIPEIDDEVNVYATTTPNLMLFICVVALSIVLVWYFRWSRQGPELALRTTRRISLFTFNWEKNRRFSSLGNSLLIILLPFFWIYSFVVPFAYHRIFCDLWQYSQTSNWNLWTIRTPIGTTGSTLLAIFDVTCITIPSIIISLIYALWFIPMSPRVHSTLRLIHTWLHMFSCVDIFMTCLIAALSGDKSLFWEIISTIPNIGHKLIDQGLSMEAYLIWPGASNPFISAAILLYFRHVIGKTLRERLETRPYFANGTWQMIVCSQKTSHEGKTRSGSEHNRHRQHSEKSNLFVKPPQ